MHRACVVQQRLFEAAEVARVLSIFLRHTSSRCWAWVWGVVWGMGMCIVSLLCSCTLYQVLFTTGRRACTVVVAGWRLLLATEAASKSAGVGFADGDGSTQKKALTGQSWRDAGQGGGGAASAELGLASPGGAACRLDMLFCRSFSHRTCLQGRWRCMFLNRIDGSCA